LVERRMLIISIILYTFTGAIACLRFFKELNLNKLIIISFLVTILFNTIIAELLNFFRALNSPELFLLLQFALCIILIVFLVDPKRKFFVERLGNIKFRPVRLRGLDWILATLIVVIIAGCFYIGTLAPINNSDSLHTHLPRIYYWLQHGSLRNWTAVTHSQIDYPIVIPIQGLWLFLLGGNENLFFLVQWFPLVVSVLLVYEISLFLGASNRQGLVAGLVVLSYPVVLLQTYSLQGDLFIAAILLVCAYLVMAYYKTASPSFLYLSILPLALSLGAKQTAFLFIPVYVVTVFLLLRKKAYVGKISLRLFLLFLASFTVFSSFKFIQNTFYKDEAIKSMFSTSRFSIPFTKGTTFKGYATNFSRYIYQWVSLDGLNGQFKLDALKIKNNLFQSISRKMNIDLETHQYISEGNEDYFEYNNPPILNEDAAWFGIISWTLIPVGLIIGFSSKDKALRNYALASLGLGLICFFPIAVLISGWSPTNGRYLVVPTILMTPMIAFILPKNRIVRSCSIIIVAVVTVYLALSTLLTNESRPVITKRTLYSYQARKIETIKVTNIFKPLYRATLNRVVNDLVLTTPDRFSILEGTYYDKLFFQNRRDIDNISLVNDNLTTTEPLYLQMKPSLLEYALFGINRTRNLYPVVDLNDVQPGYYVLVSNILLEQDRPDMELVVANEDYSLFLQK
jgi:4-amino-4-deoxy-L-arabinose transferase-like glycosyltransferase